MSCTVPHYWEEHADNIAERLQVVAEPKHSEAAIYVGTDLSGVIDARLWSDNDAFVDVVEFVEITDRPHRLQYRYELVVDGEEVERVEFDPDVDDVELQHHINAPGPGGGYTHDPAERVSLKKYLSSCFGTIQAFREMRDAEDEGLL